MNYVIYLDVFFIINLLMDFLILIIVRRMIKSKARWIRSLFGAMIGAIYICILIVLPFANKLIFQFITYFVISFIMVRIAFNIKGFKKNLKPYILLYITSFFFGGILNALYFYTEFGGLLRNVLSGDILQGLSFMLFLIITAIAFIIINLIIFMVKKHRHNSQIIYNVDLVLNSKVYPIKALLDTGNCLTEPISRQPVSLVEYNIIKESLEGINLEGGNFRMIPYRSVGKKSGLIPGFSADKIIVENSEYSDKKIVVNKPMIGIYNGEFSNTNEYQMILHPMMLKN